MPKRVTNCICGVDLGGNTSRDSIASFEEMLQRWRDVGNSESIFTGPRFEPQTSHSRDEQVLLLYDDE